MAKDSNRDLEAIEREISHTREQLGHTLEMLRYKVSPERLRSRTMDRFRPSGESGWMTAIRSHVRNNPLPYAMLGATLSWRLLSGGLSRRRPSADHYLGRLEAAYWRGMKDASRYGARRGSGMSVRRMGGERGQRMAHELQHRARQMRDHWQNPSALESAGSSAGGLLGIVIGAGLQAAIGRPRRKPSRKPSRTHRYPMATESDVNRPEAQFGVALQPGREAPSTGGLYDPVRPTDRG